VNWANFSGIRTPTVQTFIFRFYKPIIESIHAWSWKIKAYWYEWVQKVKLCLRVYNDACRLAVFPRSFKHLHETNRREYAILNIEISHVHKSNKQPEIHACKLRNVLMKRNILISPHSWFWRTDNHSVSDIPRVCNANQVSLVILHLFTSTISATINPWVRFRERMQD